MLRHCAGEWKQLITKTQRAFAVRQGRLEVSTFENRCPETDSWRAKLRARRRCLALLLLLALRPLELDGYFAALASLEL